MKSQYLLIGISVLLLLHIHCSMRRSRSSISRVSSLPAFYTEQSDTAGALGTVKWRDLFQDPYLVSLIDTALQKNQELNIFLQEIEVSRNEVKEKQGEYLPFVKVLTLTEQEKTAHYTRMGAVEEHLTIKENEPFPDPLGNYVAGFSASWELDIWRKLRNARKAAFMRYLSTAEGKNFLITQLVAEIAISYYELLMLDNLQDLVDKTIEIQTHTLHIMEQQKQAAKVTQLAVNRFAAQLLKTRSYQYEIKQRIVEVENRLNFLVARSGGSLTRSAPQTFLSASLIDTLMPGIPLQLWTNRPDIRRLQYKLLAADLEVQSAKAGFYPSIGITATAGLQSFRPQFLLDPHSFMYALAGDLLFPLINRNALRGTYNIATASQKKILYECEQTFLHAYLEVNTLLKKVRNYTEKFHIKEEEVNTLNQAVNAANNLFYAAKADYAEVLLTQREMLEAKVELLETKMELIKAQIDLYKALGGGWR